jgi:DNA-binding NarL/FixJ family response regulator
MPEAPVRVVLAEDDDLARSGIVGVLTADPGIVVVGEAGTGTEAVRLATDLAPDVVVMDLRMPQMDGVEATRQLAGRDSSPAVLVLTNAQDDSTISSLAAGASGFLLKRSHRDLAAAVRAVASGDAWIDPEVAPAVLEALRGSRGRRTRRDVRTRLTPREREIAGLMVDGLYNEEIAATLGIALPTVKTHVTRVRTKTGSRNRVEAVVAVLRAGVADL